MSSLNDIINTVEENNWVQIAKAIGISEDDIKKIQHKNNPAKELVESIVHSLFNKIFHRAKVAWDNQNTTELINLQKLLQVITNDKEDDSSTSQDSGISHVHANSNNEENNSSSQVMKEISERIADWEAFGRILKLDKSYLQILDRNRNLTYKERNMDVMETFCKNKNVSAASKESWSFWKPYLQQFDNGKLVAKEMEHYFPELLSLVDCGVHWGIIDKCWFIGHPVKSKDIESLEIDKLDRDMEVPSDREEYIFDIQNVKLWPNTQEQYSHAYNLFKNRKLVNFLCLDDESCPILETLKRFLDSSNDSGFAVKGYDYTKHVSLFIPFEKCEDTETYFCFMQNHNLVLYLTKSSKGIGHALRRSIENTQIARTLHKELKTHNVTQVNIILHNETNDIKFCNKCIENSLIVNEDTFTNIDNFTLWLNANILCILKKAPKSLQARNNNSDISEKVKQEMVSFEALENKRFPSFTDDTGEQMNQLKKKISLTEAQYKVTHSKGRHIFIRGAYGSGKSTVLLNKFEKVISDDDITYLICNDQQSKFSCYMKKLLNEKKHEKKHVIVCNSSDFTKSTRNPRLSNILRHIRLARKNKTVHVFIDEFNGAFIDNNEIPKIKEEMKFFQNSYVFIALQSMEEKFEKNRQSKREKDFGYKIDSLCEKSSFHCFELDYCLRCSVEIYEFVSETAAILEKSQAVSAVNTDYRIGDKVVDKEFGREKYGNKGRIVSKFTYNQTNQIGHSIQCGPVRIYHFQKKTKKDAPKDISVVYIATLKFILENEVEDDEKYVICTYSDELFNTTHYYLQKNMQFTCDIMSFLGEKSPYKILLTDYASVRGFEFQNVIFMLPFGKKFLKFRVIECFTRATTKLKIISHQESNYGSDKEMIKTWPKLDCVNFINCKYDKDQDKIYLEDGVELFNLETKEILVKKDKQYPWRFEAKKFKETDKHPSNEYKVVALRQEVESDNKTHFMEFLDDNKIEIEKYRGGGSSLLHIAAEHGAVNILQSLVNKIDINLLSRVKETALHHASLKGHANFVKILLQNGAIIDAKNEKAQTPLFFAALNGHLEVVKTLFENGADINAQDFEWCRPVHKASENGHLEVVKFLVINGATIRDEKTHDLLVHLKDDSVVEYLEENNAL